MQTARPTVIVVGGGYAGVLAANRVCGRLRNAGRVLLVSPDDALTDRIRLHQAAVHGHDVRQPYARLLAPGVTHIAAQAVGLEPEANRLEIANAAGHRRLLAYDALILALGSGLGSHLPTSSPLSWALRDSDSAQQLAAALPELRPGRRVAVVGGGLSAIELSAEIAEAYPHLDVELVCTQFAPGLDAAARDTLTSELRAVGVRVCEGPQVQRIEAAGLRFEDGSWRDAALCVLASGFAPAALPGASALPLAPDGRVLVDADLRVRGLSNVFAAGDFAAPDAEAIGSGVRTTRMGCASAMPLGAHAADQALRLVRGEPLVPFHFNYMIQCISVGRRRGVVLFVDRDDRPTGRAITGRSAALIKEAICRFVIGGLRLERWLSGAYAWPARRSPAILPARSE